MKKYKYILLLLFTLLLAPNILLAKTDEKNILTLTLKYYNDNNISHHLWVNAKSKIDGKFQQIPNISVSFYITNDADKTNLLGKAVTNEKGEAMIVMPPNAKAEWLKSPNQNFIVVSNETKQFDAAKTELAITKAKIKIDTINGKVINVNLIALIDSIWKPISGVEVIIGVKRLGGILNVNETQTYTTDSVFGGVTAEFKRDRIPGDKQGNIILIASLVDNETYGNLTAELKVPWGINLVYVSNFDHRSLFARRGYSPIWLELLAYIIVVVVWVIIFYLLLQIKRIKKLGIE